MANWWDEDYWNESTEDVPVLGESEWALPEPPTEEPPIEMPSSGPPRESDEPVFGGYQDSGDSGQRQESRQEDGGGDNNASSNWDAYEWLRSQGVGENVAREEAEALQRYGSGEAVLGANPDTISDYRIRSERPTYSHAPGSGGVGGDLDLNGDGKLDEGWVQTGFDPGDPKWSRLLTPPGGPKPPVSGPRGMPNSGQSLQDLLAAFNQLGQQYAGPGSAGVFPADNLQQVGQDPMSLAISGGYMNLLGNEGQNALARDMDATLRGLIERRGAVEEDPQLKAQRMEAKRQPIEAFRRMQTNQMRGELANRNLISEPGQPQGVEAGSLARIEEQLAPYYATAGQSLAAEDAEADNARLTQALSLATGLASEQSRMFLASLESATDRQRVLSEIALAALDRNMYWNRFLAELGLERDRVMAELLQGKTDSLTMLVTLFQQYLATSTGGYV